VDQSIGFDLTFTNAHLKAALFVSLLSVSLVVCLLSYINHILKRSYFGLWIIAWGFYGIWLGINFAVDQKEETPLVFVFKQFSLGAVAVFLLWGGGRFLRLKVRQEMIGLYFLFLFVWSCVGAFYLDDNPFEFQMPVFVITGLTSMIVGWGYAHPKFRRGVLGEGLMSTGFFLWGFYLLAFPFFLSHDMLASSFII